MLLCPCSPEESWAVLQDDNFCGHCGRALRGIEVSHDYVYFDPSAPAPAELSVRAVGLFPIKVQVRWDGTGEPPSWILSRFKVGGKVRAAAGGRGVQLEAELIPAGQGKTATGLQMALALDPSGVEQGREYGVGLIVASPTVPGLSRSLRVACHRAAEVEVLAWPAPVKLPTAQPVGEGGQSLEVLEGSKASRTYPDGPAVRAGARGRVQIQFRNRGGGMLTLRSVELAAPGLATRFSWEARPPAPLKGGHVGTACVAFAAAKAEHGSLQIALVFDQVTRPAPTTLGWHVLSPPVPLLHPAAQSFTVFPFEKARGVTFQIANGPPTMAPDQAALIDDLVLGTPAMQCIPDPVVPETPPAGQAVPPVRDDLFLATDHDRRHTVVGPGKSKGFTVSFDASFLAAHSTGTYPARFVVRTNEGEVHSRLLATVRPVKAFTDFIGLDFGTSNSCVAVLRGQEPQVLEFPGEGRSGQSGQEVASLLYFKGRERWVIGREAKENAVARPDRVVASIKRKLGLGRKIRIGIGELEEELEPVELAARAIRTLMGKVSVELAREAVRDPAREAQTPATLPGRAFISVPAAFLSDERARIVDACRRAGLTVDERAGVIEEPAAAALRYLVELKEATREREDILVYDFGGGTLDLSILTFERKGARRVVSVRASAGEALGGDDIDRSVMEEIARRVASRYAAFDPRALRPPEELLMDVLDPRLREMLLVNAARIREAAEAAKIALSDAETTLIPLDELETFQDGVFRIVELGSDRDTMTLTRAQFEALCAQRLESRSRALLADVCRQWGQGPERLTRVLLTGGSSALPCLRMRIIPGLLPEARVVTPDEFPPKTSVAWGVAYFGLMRTIPEVPFEFHGLLEQLNYRIGVLTFDPGADAVRFSTILPKGALPVGPVEVTLPLPTDGSRPRLYRNAGEDDHHGAQPLGWLGIDARPGTGARHGGRPSGPVRVSLSFTLDRTRQLVVRQGDRIVEFEPEEGTHL